MKYEVITSRSPVTDNSSLGRPVLLPASEFPEKKKKRIRLVSVVNDRHTSLMKYPL